MARERLLGSIAEEIFQYGDVTKMTSGDTHFEMLAAYEGMEVHATREATRRFVQQRRLNRDRLAEQLQARAAARMDAEKRNADRLGIVERWRDAGIRERMTIRSMPKIAKWGLWVLIASLDFYIFAQVMAYAENIAEPGLTDGTFWLGGAVGLMVFIVGILLAQAIRRASYFYSQKRLLRELKNADRPIADLRLSHYSRWMTFGFAIFYLVFTAGAVVLRFQGGGKQQPGLLLLQTMIPIVGVMLELLIDDPTEVRLPQRTVRDWWLSRRIGKLDMSIALRQMISKEREAMVQDRYRFERAALVNLHNDVGLTSTYGRLLADRAEERARHSLAARSEGPEDEDATVPFDTLKTQISRGQDVPSSTDVPGESPILGASLHT